MPIIARPKHALPRLALEQYCQRGHIQPKIVYEAATNALVEGLVAQNVGVGVVIADSVVLSDQVVGIPLAAQEQLHCYMQLGFW
ncbi:hypothetical protein WP50_14050 [Lactiplantibacillus plantarum]|nr:hypothetical protein WP50_14050 [Lactiplantibacillus plantarum]